MGEKQKSKSEHLLMDAIEFDEEDLESNQQGVLSQKQQQVFRAERNSWGLGVLLVLILSPMFFIFLLNSGGRNPHTLIVVIPIALIVLIHFWLKWTSWGKDYRRNLVHSAEGRVQLDVLSRENYRIDIQKMRFEVTKRVFLAFKNNDPYIIYYAPSTKRILSAEWLRE
ncbi:MAG: hypothetical protein K8L97_32025 [Anaerolineae bacterium]|nr:hypothetical protein [Anaerolineae bacterium]